MAALLKPNEMRRIKNGGIYNKGGLFNKALSEAIDEWRKRDGSGSAETVSQF
jgi:hypothetical protein